MWLTPNDEVLSLYKEVLTDIRGEQSREARNKADDLEKEVRRVEEMLNALDDKLLTSAMRHPDSLVHLLDLFLLFVEDGLDVE